LIDDKRRDVSEMFHLSASLVLISFITFALVYKLLKTREQEEEADGGNQKNGNDKAVA